MFARICGPFSVSTMFVEIKAQFSLQVLCAFQPTSAWITARPSFSYHCFAKVSIASFGISL